MVLPVEEAFQMMCEIELKHGTILFIIIPIILGAAGISTQANADDPVTRFVAIIVGICGMIVTLAALDPFCPKSRLNSGSYKCPKCKLTFRTRRNRNAQEFCSCFRYENI
jgi:sulfite exporter TauE/SafE